MARSFFTIILFTALLTMRTNGQFEFLSNIPQSKLLQLLRSLQDVTGEQLFGDNGSTEVQIIVHSPSDTIPDQQFFRRQDTIPFQPQQQFQQSQPQPQFQFQRQPHFQPLPQFQQPQPQSQFQSQSQPQFQQPQPQPQPQFQQSQPQPQFQQPQFQQPVITTQRPFRTTPQPLTESTTGFNISENFVQPVAEFRQQQQQQQKDPQFLAPGSGRWLLERDPACLTCICETASGCDDTLQCDSRGFCGPFLLSKRYWVLAGKPLLKGDNADRPGASTDCLRDPLCAAEAVRGYLDRFAQDCDGNRRVDCLDLARVHFQGPFNCRAPPFEYMASFRRCWDATARSFLNSNSTV